jgi:hypothetical protein
MKIFLIVFLGETGPGLAQNMGHDRPKRKEKVLSRNKSIEKTGPRSAQ